MSLVKIDIGKSLELSKITFEKIANRKQENVSAPYCVNLTEGTDVTKTEPFYLDIRISIKDKLFRKRMKNILKEYRYRLCYEWYSQNVGTFLKPKHERHIKMKIYAYPSRFKAIQINLALNLLSFGACDSIIDFSNTYEMKDLENFKFFFDNKHDRSLFSQQLQEIINDFYSSHYAEYIDLKSFRY